MPDILPTAPPGASCWPMRTAAVVDYASRGDRRCGARKPPAAEEGGGLRDRRRTHLQLEEARSAGLIAPGGGLRCRPCSIPIMSRR